MKRLNLVGKKFGRLTVIDDVGNNTRGDVCWLCKCDCGNEVVIKGYHLKSGGTKSCGCYNKEVASKTHKGIHLSEKHKRKISESHKGKRRKPFSKKTRQKMSKAKKGEKNGNYKHGLKGTKEYMNARASKRRARKLNQTPADADQTKIQKVYSYCAKLNETGFFRYEVDHIVPLSKGGLHYQGNLQILLAMLNHEKSDKWPLTKLERLKYKGITLKDLENYER